MPDSEIASMLPVPKSTTGEITQDDEKGFAAYVSDTPIEEYNAYVAACADKGFTWKPLNQKNRIRQKIVTDTSFRFVSGKWRYVHFCR